MTIPIPIVPYVVGGIGAKLAAPKAGAVAETLTQGVTKTFASPLDLLSSLVDPGMWKRFATIFLGLWVVYIGVLIWLASNRDVQGAAKGAVASAVTKNPAAAVAAAKS